MSANIFLRQRQLVWSICWFYLLWLIGIWEQIIFTTDWVARMIDRHDYLSCYIDICDVWQLDYLDMCSKNDRFILLLPWIITLWVNKFGIHFIILYEHNRDIVNVCSSCAYTCISAVVTGVLFTLLMATFVRWTQIPYVAILYTIMLLHLSPR